MTPTSRILITNLLAVTALSAQAPERRGCDSPVAEAALGLTAIQCLQCWIHSSGADRWVEYGAEPVVRAVSRPGGPILPGDVLVAVDGRLITTAAGGLRLAHAPFFRSTVLTVRRSGRRMDVIVSPIAGCAFSLALDSLVHRVIGGMMTAAAHFDTVRKPSYTVRFENPGRFSFIPIGSPISDTLLFHYDRDTITWKEEKPFTRNGDTVRYSMHGAMAFGPDGQGVMVTDSAGANAIRSTGDERSARGWAGFSIFCHACTVDSSTRSRMVIHFTRSPQVAGVDRGSAAEAAGFRYGASIRGIDGLDLTTPEGARRFSSLKPGDKVRFTLESGYPVRRTEAVITMPGVR